MAPPPGAGCQPRRSTRESIRTASPFAGRERKATGHVGSSDDRNGDGAVVNAIRTGQAIDTTSKSVIERDTTSTRRAAPQSPRSAHATQRSSLLLRLTTHLFARAEFLMSESAQRRPLPDTESR